ncbi:MAG: glycosyltransferase N-terminal domain-containing protein [Yoonia sp.]|nr:glycosyltransferase N-terminal domain-containing protein [Yoonia sp.]
MARSPLISAYLATVNPTECGMVGTNTPPRPKGAVIWACCAGPDQLAAIRSLVNRLTDDGEVITIIATVPTSDDPQVQISPNTKRSTRAFLAHWKPQFVLWVGGRLDPIPLFEIQNSGIPVLLICADISEIDKTAGRRVPGIMRALLGIFPEILTIDEVTSARLKKIGNITGNVQVTGILEEGTTPPAYLEAERADLSEVLGYRPMWFAANVPMAELAGVAAAHRHAARRAHRTLLVLSPKIGTDGPQMTAILRAEGFSVACRSFDETPKEATQIYVADTDTALGLWSRLAPITYLGGSLTDGDVCDPFAPATVGSAVLAGPQIMDHKLHYDRLLLGNAMKPVPNMDDLGFCVEQLLATDLAAQLAHNAWDVTSRGADATNKLVTLVYEYLDKAET